MTIKHLLVSDHCEQETHERNVYLLGLNDISYLKTFHMFLVSWMYRIKKECCRTFFSYLKYMLSSVQLNR
jgi:hypothetical protein